MSEWLPQSRASDGKAAIAVAPYRQLTRRFRPTQLLMFTLLVQLGTFLLLIRSTWFKLQLFCAFRSFGTWVNPWPDESF